MPSSYDADTQSCTLDTEHTLATITTPGVYQLTVDLDNAEAGDIFLIRQKLKVGSGGTTRLLDEWTVGPVVPTEKVFVTYPVAALHELVYTIEQTDGTGRDVPWEVVQLDVSSS